MLFRWIYTYIGFKQFQKSNHLPLIHKGRPWPLHKNDMKPRELAESVALASHPVHVVDAGGRILHQNERSLELFGSLLGYGELLALQDVRPDDHRPQLPNVLRLNTREGLRSLLLQETEHEGLQVQVFEDVSDMEAGLDEVYHGVRLDPVSQTLNPRAFLYALAEEIARVDRGREPARLMLLAIDHLEGVAQVHGPEARDFALASVAGLIQSTIRQIDVLGRPQDEALGLILPGADAQGGLWVAERSRQLVEAAPLGFQGVELALSISIGVVGLKAGESPQGAVQRVEEALREAQDKGPNQLRSLPD